MLNTLLVLKAHPCCIVGQHKEAMGTGRGAHGCPPEHRKCFLIRKDQFGHIYKALLGLRLYLWQAELGEPKPPIWPLPLLCFFQWERRKRRQNNQNSIFFLKKEVSILKATNRLYVGKTF